MSFSIILFFCSMSFCYSSSDEVYVIKTNGTKIVGRKLFTIFEDKPFAVFWKIPYAAPPIGQLRFKPPDPLRWLDKPIYNYSIPYKESCSSGYTEDCLYLSIYAPIVKHTFHFPVIVWIHENGYKHSPDFLIDEEIIVVAVSFRNSIFGFLNTGDNFAGGNMGAKDVLTALRWIRDNISHFGGDLNKVTVFGSESTAPLVASLLVSAAGEDLFHRVIIQGGSALSPADYRNYNFEIMNKLYWNLNGPFEKFNRTKLYELLSKSSTKKLLAASYDLFDSTEVRDSQRLINSFPLTVELSGKGAFMNKFPLEVYNRKITNNAVEVMIGYTNLDSLHKLDGFVRNRKLLKYLNYNFQYLLPFEGRRDEYGSKLYKKIRKKIMDFYFVNGTVGERSLRRFAKYMSDQVIYPLLRQATLHSQVSCNNVYLYRFAYRGSFSLVWNTVLRNLNLNGATSGDEICYQFKCKSYRTAYNAAETSNERLFIKRIARILGNFAKYGNPTPQPSDDVLQDLQWLPLNSAKSVRLLNMGPELKMIKLPEAKRMEFWTQLRNEFFPDRGINDEL